MDCAQWLVPMEVLLYEYVGSQRQLLSRIESAMHSAFFLSIFYEHGSWLSAWCLEQRFNFNAVFITNTSDVVVEAFYVTNDGLKSTFFEADSFNATAFSLRFQTTLHQILQHEVTAVGLPEYDGVITIDPPTTTRVTTTDIESIDSDSDSIDTFDSADSMDTTKGTADSLAAGSISDPWVWPMVAIAGTVTIGCFLCGCIQWMVHSLKRQKKRYEDTIKQLGAMQSEQRMDREQGSMCGHG